LGYDKKKIGNISIVGFSSVGKERERTRMYVYFLLFAGIGFFVGKYVYPSKKGFLLLVCIALIWTIGSGPFWGLISLGELLLGFSIYKFFIEQNKDN
jgi:hypothetical protein